MKNTKGDMGHLQAATPLRQLPPLHGIRNLFLKDESVHENGTFKDRLSHLAISRNPSGTTFACISYGNTAVSLARAQRGNRSPDARCGDVVIFLPRTFADWKLGPSSLGSELAASLVIDELRSSAHVLPVDLGSQYLDDDTLKGLAHGMGVPTSKFLNVTEGLDVPAYVDVIREAVDQLGRPPDVCLVPYGAGILCNEIRDHLAALGHGIVVPLSVGRPDSIARMLFGPLWLDVNALELDGVALSRHRSPDRTGTSRQPYPVWCVRESEILRGLRIATSLRLSTEPSAAVGLGVLPRIEEFVPHFQRKTDTVLVINTGNGIDGFLRGHPVQ